MEPYNQADRWKEEEADRLREIVSLIGSLENHLQKVKTSLQNRASSAQTSRREPEPERERELEMELKLFLIGIQLELTECPSQISTIQSLIGQLTRMLP
jgi:hypothetical protein